jgi:hypothetical protein
MKAFLPGFWIIVIALILPFSLPCYAQIETQRFLTPERTAWKFIDGKVSLHLVFLSHCIWVCSYGDCQKFDDSQYKNRLITEFDGSTTSSSGIFSAGTSVNGYVIPLLRFGRINLCDRYEQCNFWQLIRDDQFIYNNIFSFIQ